MREVASVLRLSGIAPMEDIDAALDLFGDTDDAWRSLVSNGVITEEDFFRALAEFSGLEYVELSGLSINADVIAILPGAFCRQANVLPLGVRSDNLFLAVSDPSNIQAIDDVSSITSYLVAPKIVTESALNAALDRFIRVDEELGKLSEVIEEEAADLQNSESIEVEDNDAPIVRFVNLLIAQAVRDRASDIHVEPRSKDFRVRFRIDGVLHEMQKADKTIQAGVLSRLKIMADMDIGEKRKPQDGRMSITHNNKKIDIRVASLPTVWGEKIIMRILDHSTDKRALDAMGMADRDLSLLRASLTQSHGMILVTGPTGSGKSTTLYTGIDEIANDEVNVITVEDPVEKRIDGVNQVQINNKAGMSFPVALRSILRSDPDIVMIGEIRDQETATIAVEASLTGHLVLSTLHTNGAPESLTRLVEMGIEPYLTGTSVSLIVAQRLARKLCENCKAPMQPEEALLAKVGFPTLDKDSPLIYGPVGCTECSSTGYRGRVAIIEIMEVTEAIELMVVAGQSASEIREAAKADGFKSLREDGFRRVLLGQTTIDEVMRVSS